MQELLGALLGDLTLYINMCNFRIFIYYDRSNHWPRYFVLPRVGYKCIKACNINFIGFLVVENSFFLTGCFTGALKIFFSRVDIKVRNNTMYDRYDIR